MGVGDQLPGCETILGEGPTWSASNHVTELGSRSQLSPTPPSDETAAWANEWLDCNLAEIPSLRH